MQQLIIWFINDVMTKKWLSKLEYRYPPDIVRGEPAGTGTGPGFLRPGSGGTYSSETSVTGDPV